MYPLTLAFLLSSLADPPGPPPALLELARLSTGEGAGNRSSVDAAIEPAEYPVEAAARSRQVFLLPPGPRTVREVRVIPNPGTEVAWCRAHIRLTWDGDETPRPGVDVPLGPLFGRTGSGEPFVASAPLTGSDKTVWTSRFPMPYRTRAMLEIETDRPLAGRLSVRSSKGVGADSGYFRASSWEGGPPTAFNEPGRGRLAGLVVEGNPNSPLATVRLDDRPAEPLAKAVGLEPGKPSPVSFRWLGAGTLTYDRALRLEGGKAADKDTNARVALFWYAERPAGR